MKIKRKILILTHTPGTRETMLTTISSGLLVTQFPGLVSVLTVVLEHLQKERTFIDEGIDFSMSQTKNGGRTSLAFLNIQFDHMPRTGVSKIDKALDQLLQFKKKIFEQLVEKYPVFKHQKYEKAVSFHTYRSAEKGEHGFIAHIDFGMVTFVFTLGRDFEYSEDNGKTWLKLSDQQGITPETVIINFGRTYSTFTGINPVLHRVTASGSLADYGFPEIAKFSIGLFIELDGATAIPVEIPDNIVGVHRLNWQFLIDNCPTIGDYTSGRVTGTIIEEDGVLKLV